MKIAEEYNKAWLGVVQHWIAKECWSQSDFEEAHIKFIEQIQLDAMKEGMRRATAHVTNNLPVHQKLLIREAILKASEQLTIKNL